MSNSRPFNEAEFRLRFPAFSDPTKYPTAYLEAYWEEVGCFIKDGGTYGMLQGDCSQFAMELMLAHFLALAANAARGKQGGYKTSSSVDKVSVSYLAPPAQDSFSWWLTQTPYGQQLMTLLEIKGVGGMYVGGLPERSGFRKVGGGFF